MRHRGSCSATRSGTIRLRRVDITRATPQAINRMGLARSFKVTNLFHRMTVFENLRCGAGKTLVLYVGCGEIVSLLAARKQSIAISVRQRTDLVAPTL